VPGYVDILGIALATKPVYVNGQLAYRKGEYFRKELSVNNASGPVWQRVTVTATGETPVTGNVFVPKTPEAFTYDLDGNMTSDGRWSYTWDAENRLVKVESRSDTPTGSWCRVEWTFDALGRRIRQRTLVWTNNTWVSGEELKFISDPMLFGRHVVELNATNNALVRSYVWGLDLSGTMGGAGGVGGLLWVTLHTASGAAAGTHLCAYDGNGNIVALSAASDGSETARYEYGPFGEPIRVSGSAASLNPFRFSTKRTDPATDVVLYEYRVYSTPLGQWLGRDLIREVNAEVVPRQNKRVLGRYAELLPEGPNLYGFVHNNPISLLDADGCAIPPAVIAALGVIALVEACALPQHKAAFDRYPDSGDKFKHCWVSCRISRSCGGLIAELAGLGKEIRDRAIGVYCEVFPDSEICQGGHGDFLDSLEDLLANQQCVGWESLLLGAPGGWIGTLCRRSCEDCCRDKVGYYTGEP